MPSANPSTPSGEPQRVLLVTGLSGAGKSTVLAVLEDLGWETIDNFPIRLLPAMLAPGAQRGVAPLAIGFDSRTRGFVPTEIIALAKELSERPDIAVTFMFIDCAGGELERRYNETRRRHPMARGRPVQEGIAAQREWLEPLRRWSDRVIDTTALTSNELQNHIRELFAATDEAAMTLTLSSFGFARGTPPLADMVFDMRFLDNPHWIEELRELTGQDAAVGEHIERDPAFHTTFQQIFDLLTTLLPRYAAQGKAYVHIAFGCTGGRHRSVFTVERMARDLRKAGFSPTVRHRNLGSRATDEIERSPGL
ncbi:MAG: RNase adapter RapZ [Erythrobacter sp.]|uniref:RNase adapter RapZ n=1 Tax=Erythrobacter sp. TaxID=1042 RepID=UPI00260A8E7B|nr:RNase adapter RapZ [Erythrobacter sp.]MDJ0976939.1 RNase adapter RapZ [Erythrobacter sp.]